MVWATAKRLIAKMQRKKMIHNIRALKGGLDAWEKHGYPVEPMPTDPDASRAFEFHYRFHAPRFSRKSTGVKLLILPIIPPAYCVRLIAHLRRVFVRAESD
ncbi:hypothetical protein CFB40_24890 [Burkholderia sp. AU31652]|nr:hypothetical protein CFB40_24890 [Burkholderia sp. AU31652]